MKKRAWALALALGPVWAPGLVAGDDAKKAPEPFYRQYLVPGSPLDDRIVEQEHRVEAAPDDANLRNDFGNLLAQRRFPEQAAEQYEIALKLDAKNFISAYNLGLLRETEGKVSDAISAYKRSIKRKPGFPPSHFRLGRLYERSGQLDAAVQQYAQAMRIDPAMRDPKRNPLVVDSELMYRASLANYERDMAAASMGEESVFFEESRFRKIPTDRAVSAEEASAAEGSEAAPRDVGASAAPGVTSASDAAQAGPPRRGPRPAPADVPGSILGGRPRSTPGARARTPRAQPPQAGAAAPAPGMEPAPADEATPEPAPAPTPTPGPPTEDEPS